MMVTMQSQKGKTFVTERITITLNNGLEIRLKETVDGRFEITKPEESIKIKPVLSNQIELF